MIPRLIYGLECLPITTRELVPLEKYFKGLIRKIQHLPESTATPACYILIGAVPMEALIHIKVLNMFGAITRRQDSIEFQVCERQLAIKDDTSYSWSIYVKKLLRKYSLPTPAELLYDPRPKENWNRCVKKQVMDLWINSLQEMARNMKTLAFLNTQTRIKYECHPIWQFRTSDPLMVHKAMVHAKILVQRYPLRTSHVSNSKSATCPCCQLSDETLEHFILECAELETARASHLPKIKDWLFKLGIDANPENILQAALDPTNISDEATFVSDAIIASRKMFYGLHRTRSKFIDTKHFSIPSMHGNP